MKPLLSIVIPTRNRYRTLKSVIKGILKWKSLQFEIIIQDNSDQNDEILEFLNSYSSDNRLKYFYEPKRLSAPENCDLCVLHANGHYVCLIGDDDGLLEESVNLCQYMLESNTDSASFNVGIYSWPDLKIKYYGYKLSGKITLLPYRSRISVVDTTSEFEIMLRNGAKQIRNIPKIYKGFVSKKCLDELYHHTGTYFPGPVPDMSNAVGLIPFVNKHIHVDFPMTISGASGHSMTGKGAMKVHHGKLEDVKSLPADTALLWSDEIPKFWSAQTIWAEGAHKALERTHQKSLIRFFNYNKNFAACLVYEPRFKKLIKEKIAQHVAKGTASWFAIYKNIILIYLKRIRTFLSFQFKIVGLNLTRNKYYKAKDIEEAMKILESVTSNHPMTYD